MRTRDPRRLLFVLSTLGTGGAERQAAYLAQGLARRGDAVRIVALGHVRAPVESLTAAGVEVMSLGAEGPRARLAALPTLIRLARRADVVHCTNWDASLYGRLAAVLARRPVVVADHAGDRTIQVSRRGRPRGRWVAAHHRLLSPFTAATVACAHAQEQRLLAEGVARERLVRIPNGIPVAALRTAAADGPSRAELGLPDDARIVMHVAKFRDEKNQEQTLETVAALRRSLGDVRAVFVGHGPTESGVRARACARGDDWAVFLGHRPDVPGLLRLADVVVLPSRIEAMPMVLLEAAALGVPVVAYDVGDVGRMLADTGGGIAVPAGDAAGFTAACARVLDDGALAGALSRNARAAVAGFDVDAMVDRYARLFDDAAPTARARPPVRVAHVGPDIHGSGGIPSVARDLFASPLAERYRFTYIATYGVATYSRADRRGRVLRFLRGLGRLAVWCLGPGTRVVHVHTATRGSWYRKAVCVVTARALRRPVILHVHAGANDIAAFCDRLGPLRRRVFGRAFGAADRVLSVSSAGARVVERRLGVDGVVTLPTAAPVARVMAPPPARRNGHAPCVLYLGGFANRAKGGDVLLDALPEVLASRPEPDVYLAGLGEPELQAAAGEHVRWLGWLDRRAAAAALDATDIVVLPSRSEGLPVVLLEALAHGKAVVATRVGGIPEIVTDGLDGVLVAPEDPTALGRALAGLIADPARRARLGREARRRAERLSPDEVYARLDGIYRELTERRRGHAGR